MDGWLLQPSIWQHIERSPVGSVCSRTRCRYDKALHRTHHKIENLFAELKDWRRLATRYDRCDHAYFSVASSPGGQLETGPI